MKHRLDILTILRRLRSHGNCINFLLDAKTRNECTKIAGVRTPVETIEDTINNVTGKRDWSRDEPLTSQQQFRLGLYRIFKRVEIKLKDKERKYIQIKREIAIKF